MPKLPRVSGREVLRALRRDGWREAGRRGSHVQLSHLMKMGRVTVPIHVGRTLEPNVLASILKQAGLTAEEFKRLL